MKKLLHFKDKKEKNREDINNGIELLKAKTKIGLLKTLNVLSHIKLAEQKNSYVASILSTFMGMLSTVALVSAPKYESVLAPITFSIYAIIPIAYIAERWLNKGKWYSTNRYWEVEAHYPCKDNIEMRRDEINEIKEQIKSFKEKIKAFKSKATEKDSQEVAPVNTNLQQGSEK